MADFECSYISVVIFGISTHFITSSSGQDEPKPNRSDRVQRLTRPDGSKIQVEFYGLDRAPTLILTHGWRPDSTAWYYTKKQLTDQFRVIVWDLPGLGKSKKPENRDYSLEKFARDLEAVLELAGDQPVILIGTASEQ